MRRHHACGPIPCRTTVRRLMPVIAMILSQVMLLSMVQVSGTTVSARDKEVPGWISERIAQPWTPVSDETDAILIYADTQI
ncbi:MAG TPA: hypothetical protein PLV45_09430, partial [bacterium]|nr:hypothetical protein [bacterium]